MPRLRLLVAKLLIVSLLLSVVAMPFPAMAQSTPAAAPESTPETDTGPVFVLRPSEGEDGSFFTLDAEPGSTQSLTAVIGNADDEPLSLRTYAADAFTLVNGGFGVRSEAEPVEDVAAWIDYAPETIDLEPGEGIERSFTVTVPEDAAPGEYIAGIVLQTAEPIEIEGSAMFNQVVRKSVAVFITVPGELQPAFTTGTPEIVTGPSGPRLVVPVTNDGDVLVKPAGEVVLVNDAGETVLTQQVAMGSVYAGMETTLEIPLPTALPEGELEATVRLTDTDTGAEAAVEGEAVTLSREVAGEEPLVISESTVTPMPSADDVQFAAVSVSVDNRNVPIEGARVVLVVERDGELVEEFTLAQSVTLQRGTTVIEQRYLPMEGWSAGEWTFSVQLHSVDPQTGAEAALLETDVDNSIVVED